MAKKVTGALDVPLVILRRPEVEARTGLGCSTIYDGIKAVYRLGLSGHSFATQAAFRMA